MTLEKKSKRVYRIAELIQTTLARLLQKEVFDPRLQFVTLTAVDLSPDGKNAIVFFSLLDPTDQHIQQALLAFKKATGFFRFHLSRLTELRHTPKLVFQYDNALMDALRVSQILS